jgi:hypothetical protein
MSKRTATTAPVGIPTSKRIRSDVALMVDTVNHVMMDAIRGEIEGDPSWAFVQEAIDTIWTDWTVTPEEVIESRLTSFQQRVRGVIARKRVIPAMLSADPSTLHQAVQYCANCCK